MTAKEYLDKRTFWNQVDGMVLAPVWLAAVVGVSLYLWRSHPQLFYKMWANHGAYSVVLTLGTVVCIAAWAPFSARFRKKHPEMKELSGWISRNLDIEKYPVCSENMEAAIAYLRGVLVYAGMFANAIFKERDRLREIAGGLVEGSAERQAVEELLASAVMQANAAQRKYLALYQYMVTDAKYLIEGRYADARTFRESLRGA